jgi:hypothetical protein
MILRILNTEGSTARKASMTSANSKLASPRPFLLASSFANSPVKLARALAGLAMGVFSDVAASASTTLLTGAATLASNNNQKRKRCPCRQGHKGLPKYHAHTWFQARRGNCHLEKPSPAWTVAKAYRSVLKKCSQLPGRSIVLFVHYVGHGTLMDGSLWFGSSLQTMLSAERIFLLTS